MTRTAAERIEDLEFQVKRLRRELAMRNAILDYPGLKHGERTTLATLARFAGAGAICNPSLKEIAKALGKHEAAAFIWVRGLEEKGAIATTHGGMGRGDRSVYKITVPLPCDA